jgi:PAS domain S-box-containing protein
MERELSRVDTGAEEPGTTEDPRSARWWLWPAGREAHFRSVSDCIPAFLSLVTPNGDIEIVNRHMLEYFGATPDELKCRAITDSVHPDDRPSMVAAWKEAAATGQPYDVQSRRRRVDGVYCWFHTYGFPLRDADGHIVYWFLMERDIDRQRRAEALLAGEKRFLEMVALGRPVPVVLEVLCGLFDATAEDCLSSVLLLDRSRTRVRHAIGAGLPAGYTAALEGTSVGEGEGPCGLAASLKAPVIVSDVESDPRSTGNAWAALARAHGLRACWCSPLLSLSGEVLGMLAIHRHEPGSPTPSHEALIQRFSHIAGIALERAQSEETLKRSEAFLAKAQRVSSTGSFSWRAATDEVTWSEELYRIFGLDPAMPLRIEQIAARFHPDDLLVAQEAVARARAGYDLDHENRLLMPDGSIKYIHVVAHGVRDQEGQLEFIGAIQDVTERRRSEEALSKVRSELAHMARVTTLGALTASITHEVSQPLSGILTNASTGLRMLSADPPNIEGARETARRTVRDGHRAADVIKRLRDLFGKKVPSAGPVHLNAATRDVLALTGSELRRNRVTVRTELAEELPPAIGDRVQLQQVILNLLLNASDAMRGVEDRPRLVIVRTEREGDDRVRLSVEDTGVGLQPDTAGQVFEPFYTTKSEGMGMGLSVSRSIIESHRGRIWAAPNAGPGATFAFSIPCQVERLSQPSPSPATGNTIV